MVLSLNRELSCLPVCSALKTLRDIRERFSGEIRLENALLRDAQHGRCGEAENRRRTGADEKVLGGVDKFEPVHKPD